MYHDCGIWDIDENKDRIAHGKSVQAIMNGIKAIEFINHNNQQIYVKKIVHDYISETQ